MNEREPPAGPLLPASWRPPPDWEPDDEEATEELFAEEEFGPD